MTIHEIKHPFNLSIRDGDILSENDFLLIDEKNNIYRNGIKVNIEKNLEWPLIRIISDDYFLLVDGDNDRKQDNAWIIHINGTIEGSFYIGQASNLILTESHIIAAYSKCSLNTDRMFRSNPILSEKDSNNKDVSTEGLAVFDFQGNCLFKYMSDAKDESFIPFIEIYSFLKKDEENIYLLIYPFVGNMAILEFSLKDYSMKNVLNLPSIDSMYVPKAITKKDDNWHFLGTNPNYEEKEIEKGDLSSFKSYLFKLNDMLFVEQIGECCFSNRMRGNYDGSFSVPLSIKNQYQNSCFIKI